jgi:uncharacterized membrane protein
VPDRRRLQLLPVAGVAALAAVIRFWEIGRQSFWYDESFTVEIARGSFRHVFEQVSNTESTPPLYYVLAWLWARLFGTSEAGLRSLSALLGTLAAVAAYYAAREFFGRRSALIAGALVAVNPFFVWNSQEARSYSLLVLLATLSLWALGRALRLRSGRALLVWALIAALALATHYFAVFLLVPEAIWLLYAVRGRATWLALAGVTAVGLALVPLAQSQRSAGLTDFIAKLSLRNRLEDMPKKFFTGELGSPIPGLGPLAMALAIGALVTLALRAGRQAKTRAAALLGVSAFILLVPTLLAVTGHDYLLHRNVITMYVPFALVLGAGFAAGGRIGAAAAVALCATAIVVNLWVVNDTAVQRDDWRSAAAALGRPTEPRLVVVSPDIHAKPLQLYTGPLALPPASVTVREIDVLGAGRPPRFPIPGPPPGFTRAGSRLAASWLLVRYRAPRPLPVGIATAASLKLGPKQETVLLQNP